MALRIEFEGWVNEVKDFSWGSVLKMSHNQRAKNDAGEWETVGKDYIDVKVSHDRALVIPDAKIVRVFGTFKLETYTKRDGTQATAIVVNADRLESVDRDPMPTHVPASGIPQGWTPIDEDAPF